MNLLLFVELFMLRVGIFFFMMLNYEKKIKNKCRFYNIVVV